MKRKLKMAVITVVGAYVVICAAMFLLQRKLLFLPPGYGSHEDRIALTLRAERVELTAEDGQQLFAWWMAERLPSEPYPGMKRTANSLLGSLPVVPDSVATDSYTWLNLGGNAAQVSSCLSLASTLLPRGHRLLRVAYRGYSGNDGSPTEAGLQADALAAWDWLRARGIPADSIIVCGKSLGGGVAMALLEKLDERGELPAAVVLETTFTSVPDRAAQLYPFLPVRWLVLDRFDNARRLEKVAGKLPVAIIGATEDNVVPFAMNEALHELVPGSWFGSCNCDHNTVILSSDRVLDNLLRWLATQPGEADPDSEADSEADAD